MTHSHDFAVMPRLFSHFVFSVDTDVGADVDTAGGQGALVGSRVETKALEEKWKQEDPDTHE